LNISGIWPELFGHKLGGQYGKKVIGIHPPHLNYRRFVHLTFGQLGREASKITQGPSQHPGAKGSGVCRTYHEGRKRQL
jgi:hypothetical protein